MKRVVHWELDEQMTRCGLTIDDFATTRTVGSREYVLQTTRERKLITCKRCIRSLEREAEKKP
jgi:hypothetical protein